MKQLQLQKQYKIKAFHYFRPPLILFLKKESLEDNLQDSLLKQLVFLRFKEEEKYFIELMLDALDEEGFLTVPCEELRLLSGLGKERAQQIKILLQNLEPEGLFQERLVKQKISYEKRIPECAFDGKDWFVFHSKIQGLVKIFYQRNQLLVLLSKKIYQEAYQEKKLLSYKKVAQELNIHESTLYRLVKEKYFQLFEEVHAYEDFFLSQKKQVLEKEKIFYHIYKKFPKLKTIDFQKRLMSHGFYFALRTINKYRKKLLLR